MAIMIPEKPRDFEPASQEGVMFDALSELSDEYYIFHSFRITTTKDNVLRESETDFVVFNKNLGVVCIEAKAGKVKYENGVWLYGSGIKMHHGGPFNQASANKYKLMNYIENTSSRQILGKCKFLHAVWFPSLKEEQLRSMKMPSEGDKKLVLTKEALSEPERFIKNIFSIELPNKTETNLSDIEAHKLVREILCPQFNVFPSASFDSEIKKMIFHRLLKEQAGILNYLEDQRTAAINGAAGTGKTMIAVEKARRHAMEGDRVLFLCYNVKLKEHLQENYPDDNVAYSTIASFVCALCNTTKPDYQMAQNKLEDLYISGAFPYKHVIIDEGQDFGIDDIEENRIINTIKDIVTDNSVDGTFYVFYDKLQLIQAKNIPAFIEELDCRLTLYKNCRNTENIALTSLRPVSERTPKLFEGAVKGVPAKLHYCDNEDTEVKCIDSIIEGLESDGIKDIAIISCKSEGASILSPFAKEGNYRNCLFTTARKFKGLEADAVILIDANLETFTKDVLIYYVGASRARIRLDVVTSLSDDDCTIILNEVIKYSAKIGKPKRTLASALNAVGKQELRYEKD